ncbi:MAG: DUF2723 domain-containing protein [Anaerolineae bacterium]|nr:DUF2723 domain-containing protein [Anaerolineae bacterium]
MQNLLAKTRDLSRRGWPWALAVFILLVIVYLRTLLPGTAGGDAGELQYAGPLLALVHPMGQPLYVMLGFLWSHIMPIGSIAWRMNLLAAIFGAAGCAFLTWTIHRLSRNPIVALAAGLTLGLGSTLWGQAVIADKYGFNVFLASLVIGLALWWVSERDQPHGDKLLYALCLAYGLSLLHHQSMFMFAPGLGLLVVSIEKQNLWKNWRRTLICAALVLLPALIIYPLFLPFAQARNLAPFMWKPEGLKEWIDWWSARHVVSDELLVFDSWANWSSQLTIYIDALFWDYTVVFVVVAVIGLILLGRRFPFAVVFMLVTYVLVGSLGANFRANVRQFTYYLPSFVILGYAYGIGLGEGYRILRERFGTKFSKWRLPAAIVGIVLLAGVIVIQFGRAYPLRRNEAVYGYPLDAYRQTLKTGDMGDRLVANMADLPQYAVVLADWEQVTILWYKQKVEGLRPDLTLRYPIEQVDDFAGRGQPICLARILLVGEEWHPTNVGPLVCLNREPVKDIPEGFTSLDKPLVTEEGNPQIELAAYRLDQATIPAGQYVPLTLAWRALIDHPEDYSISLHILTEDWQQVWSQDVASPVLGMYPTSRWVQDEVVVDYHELAIPREMPPARYLWTVVVYQQREDGSFAQLRDAEGNIEVLGGTFEVVPAR